MTGEDQFTTLIEARTQGHCTGYVIVATIERIDDDRTTQAIFIQTPEHQTSITSLGLARAVTAIEERSITEHFTSE